MLPELSRFVLPPLILLTSLGGYRVLYEQVHPAEPAAASPAITRAEPLRVTPQYNWPAAVSDEQLARVMDRLKPPVQQPLTNNLVHALRLWGPHAEFDSEQIPSGSQMLNYLLQDSTFQRWAGPQTPPLWSRTNEGVRPRNYEDDFTHSETSSYHVDDLLATLAESGVTLETPLQLRDGSTVPVRELLQQSLSSYFPQRFEYEWTLIAAARYLQPGASWRNRYGELLTPAKLVEELTRHKPEMGPCNGLHRLEALVLLYRADEASPQMPSPVKQRLLAYMQRVSRLLQSSQSTSGFWTRRWVEGEKGQADASAPLSDKILVTGHQLEWLALAPEEILPPREQIIRACQWLARTIPELEERELQSHYGPYSHAARALCLWRATEPYAAWRNVTAATGTTAP